MVASVVPASALPARARARQPRMDRRAYVLAFTAILLWSGLACAADELSGIDPLLVAGIGLVIGGLLALPRWRSWRAPPATWAVGIGGILGYHVLYFAAFAHAPAVAVNLINYLWPLLIVALAPVVLGGRPAARQLVGALLGLLGTVLLVGGFGGAAQRGDLFGYALAASAAVVWALYSLITKRLSPFSTAVVGGFCLVSGLGALGVSVLSRGGGSFADLGLREWALLAGIGIGPLGAAFYCWDAALKRGDPRVIGALAYLTPLLSTGWLVLLRGAHVDWRDGVALALIVGGAALGGMRRNREAAAAG